MKFRNKWVRRRLLPAGLVAVPIALALSAGTVARQDPPLGLINETPSLPRGLYWRLSGAEPVSGSVVAVPQPPAARHYLASLGVPAEMLLIKRVVASGGEVVCVRDRALAPPKRRYRVLDTDRRGQALPVWSGCRVLAPDELFVLGDTDTSFDSRHFGPVQRRDIVGVYREALRW